VATFDWNSRFIQQDIEIKQTDLVYNGFFRVEKLLLRHKKFDDTLSPWLERERIQRYDAAAVILFDEEQQSCVFVEQLRVGLIHKQNASPWLLEIVAGLIEPGETPEQTVVREAYEEAGCTLKKLIKITEYYNTPGGFAEKTYVYCGLVSNIQTLHKQSAGSSLEQEDILIHVLPFQSAWQALQTGKWQTSGSTLIAMQWLAQSQWIRNGSD